MSYIAHLRNISYNKQIEWISYKNKNFKILFPFGRKNSPLLLESTSPKEALCQVWLKLDQYRHYQSTVEKGALLFCESYEHANLNLFHSRMPYAKFGWNWPTRSDDFFMSSFFVLLFCYYLLLEKGKALHLDKF